MKLLINFCGHDGVISHYAGVGTIVRRYIEVLSKLFKDKNIDYDLNLFTLEFNPDSMGYNKDVWDTHASLPHTKLYILSNGTNGETSFGNIDNWTLASKNTAKVINDIDFTKYDYVINLCNDTPYALLTTYIKESSNSYTCWIPHSTGKIYNEDMSLSEEKQTKNERVEMEQNVVNYINTHERCYVLSTGEYIRNHMINEYGLKKNIDFINGELLYRETFYPEDNRMKKLFEEINQNDSIIMALGRAEKYKNLDKTMLLGEKLGIKPVVITAQYFPGQPIIKEYEALAQKTNALLYVDEPFSLPQYIVKHYTKPMILLIPSEREIFGLIINEFRRFNKDNVLIVANDRGGLHEQITSGFDGVHVDLDDIKKSAETISKYFNKKDMIKLNKNGQKTLNEKYNLMKTVDHLFCTLLGEDYEKLSTKR